jgi:hypothetical protein
MSKNTNFLETLKRGGEKCLRIKGGRGKRQGKSKRKFTTIAGENNLVRISKSSSDHPSTRSSMKVKNIWIRAGGDFNNLLNAETHNFIITLFNTLRTGEADLRF